MKHVAVKQYSMSFKSAGAAIRMVNRFHEALTGNPDYVLDRIQIFRYRSDVGIIVYSDSKTMVNVDFSEEAGEPVLILEPRKKHAI